MKLIKLKCSSCGADLEVDIEKKQVFCVYCGAKLLIDDESIVNKNVFVDEARIREAELKAEVEKKKLDFEREKFFHNSAQNEEDDNQKVGVNKTKSFSRRIIGVIIVAVIAIVIIVSLLMHTNKDTGTETVTTSQVVDANNNDNGLENQDEEENAEKSNTSKNKMYKNGEMAKISDENGEFEFGVTNAVILKENGNRDAVYQITWEVKNKNYTSNLGTGTSAYEVKVIDSDGYIVEPMNSGWDTEWANSYTEDQPKAGENCKVKHTFIINNPECTYLDITLEKHNVTCRINISDLENGKSIIPANATKREAEIIKVALGYDNSIHPSYEEMVSQLEYEGYSHKEAVYGADHCGADWNENAVQCAKSYIDSEFSFTKDEMIKQLIEGNHFTEEQAKYGADNCGEY